VQCFGAAQGADFPQFSRPPGTLEKCVRRNRRLSAAAAAVGGSHAETKRGSQRDYNIQHQASQVALTQIEMKPSVIVISV
jgi:hypothetical protein